MSLLDNQTYRKKISFVKTDNHDKAVQIVFSVQCNHEIDKSILSEIEKSINEMFLKDYEDVADIEKQKVLDKELAKKDVEIQKELKRQQLEKQKQQAKINKQNELQNKQQQLVQKQNTLSNLLVNKKK
jgi:ABC-type lipoprotein release transport system permease subunit